MKRHINRLTFLGIIGILFFFSISLFLPQLIVASKVGALGVYALISYIQIQTLKKRGEDIQKPTMFAGAVILIIGYLLFFF